MSVGTLVLLRHGESTWNAENRFTGWVDVPLSQRGEAEALRAGELMADAGLRPKVVNTSLLRRSISTANIALDRCDRHWIPVRRTWRLNERHYGALQGKNKAEIRQMYGDEQFALWRRSYDTPPPRIADGSEFAQDRDPRYAHLSRWELPRTECLADVVNRLMPFWIAGIAPDLRDGLTVLVAAHGNSLRAMVKHLDQLSDEEVVGLNIPTGIPLVYEFDSDQKVVNPGGRYLDPEAAATAIHAVANQGR
jgi:2,3-bisphosphoglycerate-dependent phosphoglycerate mutase